MSYHQTVWPAPHSPREDVSATFGPLVPPSAADRRMLSADCPDGASECYPFHHGVNIEGNAGDPIVAVQNGTVARVTSYSCGGLTIDVMHEFSSPVTFRPGDDPVDRYFTRHQHVGHSLVSEGQHVGIGQQIGEVGSDGQCADAPRLHFELILGTSGGLVPADDDDRIHPYLILPHMHGWTPILEQVSDIGPSTTGTIKIDTRNVQPNVARYEVQILTNDQSSVRASHTFDLNLHTGFDFDAAHPDVYVPDASVPHLSPKAFDTSTALHSVELVIPAGWVPPQSAGATGPDVFKVAAVDVRGHRYETEGTVAYAAS